MNPSLTRRRLALVAIAALAVVGITVAALSRGASASRAGAVQAALVNINTNLGYQQASAAGTSARCEKPRIRTSVEARRSGVGIAASIGVEFRGLLRRNAGGGRA